MSHRIRAYPSGHQFEAQEQETILQAGLGSGLNLAYSCETGNCGECRIRVLSGRVEPVCRGDYPMSAAERQAGWVLGCCTRAAGDLEIEAREIDSVEEIPEQVISARVSKLEFPNPDTLVLHLRTPRSKLLRFLAGQRVELGLGDGLTRELPLASCPCDGRNLRCHLPRTAGDPFSAWAFQRLAPRQELEIRGPRGRFTLDEDRRGPLLFIAEETGFAAVESLIEHAIALEWEHSISLYWLSARPGGQYLDNYCRSWVDALDEFRYQRVELAPVGQIGPESAVRKIMHTTPLGEGWSVYAATGEVLAGALSLALGEAGSGQADCRFERLEWI